MLKNRRKLSRELSLGVMLMTTPIFILSLGILYWQSNNLIHQEVTECSHSMLNTTLHRVRTYMSTIEMAANSNAWLLEEHFRPDSMQSVSNRIVRLNAPVISSSIFAVPDMFKAYGHSFSIYTVNHGDTVTTYCEPEYDYFDKACYTTPVNTGRACWVDPFIDNAEGKVDHNEAIATYCRPLRQKDGRIVGVVTADLSFSRMARMLNEVEHPYPNAYFVLLGGDGRFLIYPDTTQLFRKTIFTDADPVEDMDIITLGHEMTAGKQGTIHIRWNGELYHVSYQPVPGTDWSLALACPDSDAMKSFYSLGIVIVILLIVGLLFILVLCNRVVKQTISPIVQLTNITQQIAEGQCNETIPVSHHDGLFAQLQNSFARMQQSLSGRMGSLRRHADEVRQHNEKLTLAKQQAEDIIQQKSRFIHRMTQQMRMPLNAIAGFSNVLGDSLADEGMVNDEELDSITEMMSSNVINMNRMVLMMFDATSTDVNGNLMCQRVDEVSCNGIARDVIDHIQRHFPLAKIQFDTELQDAIHILTNRVFLLCVLIEPLYNAVHHSDGQHVSLHVGQTETTVTFTIQDVGSGVPAEPKLSYNPFAEIDSLQIGVGMGLPLAKRHAASLGGSLTIDTNYREGCRIVIEMPK
jgi:signal transduction histidine kinase